MGYLHINNLYKEQKILLFKECYALEKIHGTSAHITFKSNPSNKLQRQLVFFAGGESHNNFVSLFDKDDLFKKLNGVSVDSDKDITIYGEAYGGKQQGMSATYGQQLKFIVFDVQIGDYWLDVLNAEDFVKQLNLEFVSYEKVSTDLTELDIQRDKPSIQAIKNGVSEHLLAGDEREKLTVCNTNGFVAGEPCWYMGRVLLNPRKREGVVLRPLIEVTLNNGERLICKHKGDDFSETATPRPVVDPSKMKVLDDAIAIANDWVTLTRLEHVLDKLPGHSMERMRDVIAAMQDDVLREGKGEIVESEAVKKSIGKKTVEIYKNYLKKSIGKKTVEIYKNYLNSQILNE